MSIALTAPALVRLSPKGASHRERRMLDELVARLRSRDDEAVDRVLRELVPEVRNWMFRHLGPRHDVEDATQDALSEIASALFRFEGRSTIATLAYRITLRTSYRYYRRPTAAPDASEIPIQEPHDPEMQVSARRALRRLHEALGKLPERRRSAFVLCAIEGMDPMDAADVLDVSPNAMRSLLCRARQQLEAILAQDDDLGSPR